MATTVTPAGAISASISLSNLLAGDQSGAPTIGASVSRTMKVSAAAPEIEVGGGWYGIATATTVTSISLAHATDPLQGLGDAAPAQGYSMTGRKLCALYMENLSSTITVDVKVPAANGLVSLGWAASGWVCVLQPYGFFCMSFPAGSATLTAGTNDLITLTTSSSTAQVKIVALFF